MPAIKTEGLSKRFGGFTAVNAIDLEVMEGELFGFLGPNGAGKTTTISMLATMLSVSSGNAFVNGFNVSEHPGAVRKSIGIVFQDPCLDIDLTASENLEFHARLYSVPENEIQGRVAKMLSLVELSDKADWLVKKFSSGMKRRLEIAKGLLHNPKVLFLDEPTLGLDPQTRRKLWEYIRALNKREKTTVILTTHYLGEADFLCDRIAVIDHGKIVALDTPENLKKKLQGEIVRINSSENAKVSKLKIPGILSASVFGNSINFSVNDANTFLPMFFSAVAKEGISVHSVEIHRPSLEDVFIQLTGHYMRDDEASASEQAKASLQQKGFVRR